MQIRLDERGCCENYIRVPISKKIIKGIKQRVADGHPLYADDSIEDPFADE